MYEIAIMGPEDIDEQGAEYLAYLQSRLPQLLEIAHKLVQAGWTIFPTLTGLGLKAPEGEECEEYDDEADPERPLQHLGIDEKINMSHSRTPKEVGEALDELFDRIWYERTLVYLADPSPDSHTSSDVISGMLKNMNRVEQKYGLESLIVESDFDWGMINGKLSALRWILGDEWDFLDT